MKRIFIVMLGLLLLAGCNTVEGVGEDISAGARAVGSRLWSGWLPFWVAWYSAWRHAHLPVSLQKLPRQRLKPLQKWQKPSS